MVSVVRRLRKSIKPSVSPGVRPSQGGGARGQAGLRIIGGVHRGRRLEYHGDPRTRPMKDRVREAVFNLLADQVAGKHVLDLFAGTGALGLEALSRGAERATFFERHFPTAELIRRNATALGLEAQTEVIAADTLVWFRRGIRSSASFSASGLAWLVFCSPPYALYRERRDEVLSLLNTLMAVAPPESVVVVEADESFDFASLSRPESWLVRSYPPARIGIFRQVS